MSKTLLAESFGQRSLDIFTALSPFYVEQPHGKGSALYKYPTNRCKNNLESSADPSLLEIVVTGDFYFLFAIKFSLSFITFYLKHGEPRLTLRLNMQHSYYVKTLLSLLFFSSTLWSKPSHLSDKVVIPTNNWSSQRVLSNVVGQLIENLDVPVEYVNISADRQWGALKRGVIHFQIEVWEPSMGQEFNQLVASGDIIDLGTHEAKVIEDWWYPKYVENLCPELPQWQALNQCRALFKGSKTMGKGIYFGGPWNYGDADIIRALGLNFSIERLPDAAALWKELSRATQQKRPILMLNWSPNWTDDYIDGEFVNFPLYSEQCEKEPEWGLNKKLVKDCGNRRGGWLKKAATPNLKQRFPCVYNLIQNISFTNRMISDAASLAVVEKLSDQAAAIEWSKKYANSIKKWSSLTCQQ